MSRFSIFLIILDIWQAFEYASGIKYVGFQNMLQHSDSNIIIIVTNVVILEFLSVRFLHAGAPQRTIFSFFFNKS